MPTLYVIPSSLSENNPSGKLSQDLLNVLHSLNTFVVEGEKNARRFLKSVNYPHSLNELELFELNEHTKAEEILHYLNPLKQGKNMGLMSDAGCPGIADPGAELVKLAHELGFKVEPLVGPNSIILALMASGLNGQSFAFNGYLPREQKDRIKKIQWYERIAKQQKQTQLFIETPYRNLNLFEDLLNELDPNTMLCVAADITSQNEFIKSMPVYKWKKEKPDINKKPAVFLFL